MSNNRGQTMLEMVVVIAVALLVVSSITFATIASLRNAQFAKNQVQATKFAQEGIEKTRSIRDRNGEVVFRYSEGGTVAYTSKFSDLWTINMGSNCNSGPCFFKLDSANNRLSQVDRVGYEQLGGFKRQVQFSDIANPLAEKQVTVEVVWTDFAGDHQSQLTTILRKVF